MTRKTYIATIDSYIPLASAWADREIGLTNGKQRCGNKWIAGIATAAVCFRFTTLKECAGLSSWRWKDNT